LSAIASDPSGHVDARAFGQRDDRLLEIGAVARPTPHSLEFSLDADRVDRIDLNREQTAALTSRLVAVKGTLKIT